jgi:putative transposase
MNAQNVNVRVLAHRAPNLHAHVERFIQAFQVECLDHFLVFGEKHFDYLAREFVEHYHTERPHQGLGNKLLVGEPSPDENQPPICEAQCSVRLGGLLKHYRRAAA